jgi:PAS domain S-box-containing protein
MAKVRSRVRVGRRRIAGSPGVQPDAVTAGNCRVRHRGTPVNFVLLDTGRTLAQEVGDGGAEGVHPDDFDRCVTHYLDHLQRRQAFEMEYRLRRHDGEWRWIFDRGVPFADDGGEFAGFIGSCVDVDERRKARDAQITHDQVQLALARDFEKWILAIVGHDIRNPLGSPVRVRLSGNEAARGG